MHPITSCRAGMFQRQAMLWQRGTTGRAERQGMGSRLQSEGSRGQRVHGRCVHMPTLARTCGTKLAWFQVLAAARGSVRLYSCGIDGVPFPLLPGRSPAPAHEICANRAPK